MGNQDRQKISPMQGSVQGTESDADGWDDVELSNQEEEAVKAVPEKAGSHFIYTIPILVLPILYRLW